MAIRLLNVNEIMPEIIPGAIEMATRRAVERDIVPIWNLNRLKSSVR
jgi:hypothetical protein